MHRSEDGGGWLNLGASLSESYSDSTVSAGSSYSYSVVSVSAADSGVQGAAVTLNDVVVPGDSNTYEDALGKGGGSYIYQVCEMADATNCSNTATVVF